MQHIYRPLRSFSPISRSFSRTAASSAKKTLEQLIAADPTIVRGANVLVRVDFNVPLSKDGSKITDDTRIREALPTIKKLQAAGAKTILASHLGRPNGKPNPKMKMDPVKDRLSALLNTPVTKAEDCIGDDVDNKVKSMQAGDILLLENVRFHAEEEDNNEEFARKLAKHAQVYVNDAFGTAHRAHASTEGVSRFVRHKVAGYLMDKELRYLQSAVDSPQRPLAAIIGGAKVSTKISVIESLLRKCDKILLGGGMTFTFLKAQGYEVGKSLLEPDFVDTAAQLLQKAKASGVTLMLPSDVIVATPPPAAESTPLTVAVSKIPADMAGFDIGPQTIREFEAALGGCRSVVWNGPMGVFEVEQFSNGTTAVAKILARITEQGGVTIVGGGDSVAAVEKAKLANKMSHISTGGGASLELLEGKVLPGVAALDDA